jgi:hypothetical protein
MVSKVLVDSTKDELEVVNVDGGGVVLDTETEEDEDSEEVAEAETEATDSELALVTAELITEEADEATLSVELVLGSVKIEEEDVRLIEEELVETLVVVLVETFVVELTDVSVEVEDDESDVSVVVDSVVKEVTCGPI